MGKDMLKNWVLCTETFILHSAGSVGASFIQILEGKEWLKSHDGSLRGGFLPPPQKTFDFEFFVEKVHFGLLAEA